MRNSEHRLESPAQAVNALTVGAATERQSDAWQGFAPVGDLCPSSRTSQTWEQHDAYKPDIVMEGGNHILDDDPLFSRATNHTLLLTTRSEEHTSELQSLMRISYAVFCLKKQNTYKKKTYT